MIIGSILYTLIETILGWLLEGITYLAQEILSESFEITATTNIFQKSIDFIPFSSDLHLASVIRGLAIAIVIFLLVVAAIKSIAAPITGDEAPNVLQVLCRAAISLILIFFIFGTNTNANTITSVHYNGSQLEEYVVGKTLFSFSTGLLGTIGVAFGKVLSYIAPNMNDKLKALSTFDIDPKQYLAWIVLTASLLTQVFGSAITILERFITLGVSAMFGPICTAMYTSKDTADTFKNWCLSILTQFLALFLSMTMWVLFINSCNKAFENQSIFQIAVSIVILTLVKNSEKIFNSFGLKTMSMGDTARSVAGGFGAVVGAGATAFTLARFARMGKGGGGRQLTGEKTDRGVSSPFDDKGRWGTNDASRNTHQLWDLAVSANPVSSGIRTSNQNQAIRNITDSIKNKTDVSAKQMNTAIYGNENGGKRTTISGYNNSDTMRFSEAKSLDGKNIEGYCGNITRINSSGEKESFDAFIPTSQETSNFMDGASLGIIDGHERFISGGPVIDSSGQSYYRMTTTDPNVDFNQINKTEIAQEKPVISEQDFPANN